MRFGSIFGLVALFSSVNSKVAAVGILNSTSFGSTNLIVSGSSLAGVIRIAFVSFCVDFTGLGDGSPAIRSLEPLIISFVNPKDVEFKIPTAATFELTLENKATSPKMDPKRIFSANKVVTQVMTYLNEIDSNKVTRPAFAVKFSPTRVPPIGKKEDFTIQFLTNDLAPNAYNITFELQTPSGESVQRIQKQITLVQERTNKQSE